LESTVRSYDYVIVGGGTAGSVLAGRLSSRPEVRVLLLEAGPATGPAAVDDPMQFPSLLGSTVDWATWTVEQSGIAGRVFLPHGKMLGGSSSINASAHVRGNRASYDAWVEQGAAGWSYRDLLPHFLRSENAAGRDPNHRGTDGVMTIDTTPADKPVLRAVFDAMVAKAYPRSNDLNGANQLGVGWGETNTVDGRRQSAADAYLTPVTDRSNLEVVTGALVQRVVFDGTRCTGVDYLVGAKERRAQAAAQVIVAAGTIGSPQLLMVSGIGPAQHLHGLGIEVVADLPGVGANLHDHPHASVVYEAGDKLLASLDGPPELGNLYVRLRTDPALVDVDIQVVIVDRPYYSPTLQGPDQALTLAVGLMTPTSRGTVRLAAADISTPPLVDPNYLSEPHDVSRMITGIRMARTIGELPGVGEWVAGEVLPGTEVQSDAALHEYLRNATMSYFHPVGTCRMGVDPIAVVDPGLRVHGIEGLRVVDASVMPSIPSGNTNATVLAIAERAAAEILRERSAASPQSI
jgi:choline dehydrogenase